MATCRPVSAADSASTTQPARAYYRIEGIDTAGPAYRLIKTDAEGNGSIDLSPPVDMPIISENPTPDGGKIICLRDTAYARKPVGQYREELIVMNSDGQISSIVPLEGLGMKFGPPTLLADGRHAGLVACLPDPDAMGPHGGVIGGATVCSIHIVDLNTKSVSILATCCELKSEHLPAKFGVQIDAMDCDGATWSPDGKTILLTLLDGKLVENSGNSHWLRRLYAMNADASNLHPVATEDTRDGSFSPDGSKIAYIKTAAHTSDIVIANADGSQPVQLTNMGGILGSPRWLSDGHTIIFFKAVTGTRAMYGSIWAIESDGSRPRQISTQGAAAWLEQQNEDSLIEQLRVR